MATEKRTSEQGDVFGAAVLREFLLAALEHDAVTDRVHDLIYEHVVEQKYHPAFVASSLEPIITEVLATVIFADWEWVADTFIQQACDALEIEYHLSGTEAKLVSRSTDARELREQLADVYTHARTAPRALRAWWITRRISQLTGIARETIRAEARSGAEAIKATREDDTADADQSSDTPELTIDAAMPPVTAARKILRYMRDQGGHVYIEDTAGNEYEGAVLGLTHDSVKLQDRRTEKTTTIRLPDIQEMIEVEVDLPNLFVRPMASEEVYSLGLIMVGRTAGDLPVRTQAAILLGSNAGCTTSQIAAMLVVDEAKVRQVITDVNDRGAEAVAARQAEREHVVKTARNLDPQTFDIDTRLGQPGKYEGASDLQLVVALDIINGHGFADESTGETAISGYAWRINRFVGVEDSQGFIRAEEWPTAREATERLRDFDLPAEDEASTDQSSNTPEATTAAAPPRDSDDPSLEERLYAHLELILDGMGYDEARGDWWRVTHDGGDSWGVKGVIDGEDISFDVTPLDLGPTD
jgi:hypothetical protein